MDRSPLLMGGGTADLMRIATVDPAQAVVRCQKLLGDAASHEQTERVITAIRELATAWPETAGMLLSALGSARLGSSNTSSLLDIWLDYEPAEAGKWFLAQPLELQAFLSTGFLESLDWSDPAAHSSIAAVARVWDGRNTLGDGINHLTERASAIDADALMALRNDCEGTDMAAFLDVISAARFGGMEPDQLARALERSSATLSGETFGQILTHLQGVVDAETRESILSAASGLKAEVFEPLAAESIEVASGVDGSLQEFSNMIEILGAQPKIDISNLHVPRAIAGMFACQSRAEIVAWAEAMPAGPIFDAVFGSVAKEWALTDSLSASEWVASLPPGERKDTAIYEMITAIPDDGDSAGIWLKHIQSSEIREEAIRYLEREFRSVED